MDRIALISEFLYFVRYRKAWWLVPVLVALLVVGFLVIVAESSAIAPFIYPLF